MQNYNFKFKILIVLLFFIFFYFPFLTFNLYEVSAHILKTSGSVGGVIHITPDDDPIAGEQADFYFEFKDKQNKFKVENCDCKVVIIKSGEEIYSGSLFQNSDDPSLSNASFSHTFPEKDIYKIKVIGVPLTNDAFEAFSLEYDIRVSRESEKNTTADQNNPQLDTNSFQSWVLTHIPHIIVTLLILGLLVVGLIKQISSKKI